MRYKSGVRRNCLCHKPNEKKYVCSISYGKDSLATLLLALENGEPLDAVVFVEVMYDLERGISGEHPDHIKWVNEVARPRLLEMGVEVIHLRSDKDYVGSFHTELSRGKHVGKLRGFPIANRCCIQKDCKLRPINTWLREGYFKDGYDVVMYVGIAVDELDRLESLEWSDSPRITKVSLMEKYRYTETMALLKCHEYGLVSPIYLNGGGRNGCWFCPNQNVESFCRLRCHHFDLWHELKKLSKTENIVTDQFRYAQTFADVENNVKNYFDKYHKYIL